jgi:hypothetical protein
MGDFLVIHTKLRIPLVLILAVGTTIRLCLAWRSIEVLDTLFLLDDTYLSLGIARNIALGYGSTFDRVIFTNGYQPFYVWLMVPIYGLFPTDKTLPVHIALSILAICDVFTGWFIYRIVSCLATRWHGLLACAIWMLDPLVLKQSLNGLETSLVLLSVVSIVYWYISRIQSPHTPITRHIIVYGLLAGSMIFNRIDQAILLLALVFDMWQKRPRRATIQHVTIIGALVLLVNLPWFSFGVLGGSGPIPESGAAVRYQGTTMAQGEPGVYLRALPYMISELLRTPTLTIPILLIALIVLIWYRWQKASISWTGVVAQRLRPLHFGMLYTAILFTVYWLVVPGYWYFDRYISPVSVFILPVIVVILPQPSIVTDRRWRMLLHVSLVVGLSILGYRSVSLLSVNPESNGYRKMALWIDTHLPGQTVAAYQAGAIGYWSTSVRVVNLDGVVDREALTARRTGRVLEYARQRNASWIIDWESRAGMPTDGEIFTLRPYQQIPDIQTWGNQWYLFKVNNVIDLDHS